MALDLVTPFTKVQLEEEIKDTGRKQVGILGGNFNPVHNAHLVVADQVRQQLGLDEVLLMPGYEPPHVDKKETIDEIHTALICLCWLLTVSKDWTSKPLSWNVRESAILMTP